MEFLGDPLNDRKMPDVLTPVHSANPVPDSVIFPYKGKASNWLSEVIDQKKYVPDWKAVKEYLGRSGKMSKKQVHRIVTEAIKVFSKCN